MQRFPALIFFLTSCLAVPQIFVVAQNNPSPNQKLIDSIIKNWQILNDSITENWQIKTDNNVRTAFVKADGTTPKGKAQTVLWLQCAKNSNYVTSIDYIIRDSGKIKDFDFGRFEGPDAPASKKKLVEFRAVSPKSTLYFREYVAGWYGGLGKPDSFVFSRGTTKLNKIMQLAQMVANGSTKVTLIVHDYQDYSKTIETTFPAIDASSEIAKMLNGCRLPK